MKKLLFFHLFHKIERKEMNIIYQVGETKRWWLKKYKNWKHDRGREEKNLIKEKLHRLSKKIIYFFVWFLLMVTCSNLFFLRQKRQSKNPEDRHNKEDKLRSEGKMKILNWQKQRLNIYSRERIFFFNPCIWDCETKTGTNLQENSMMK